MFSLPFLSGPTRRHPPPCAPRPRELRLHIATGQPSSPTRLYNYKAPHSHALRPLTLAAPALPASFRAPRWPPRSPSSGPPRRHRSRGHGAGLPRRLPRGWRCRPDLGTHRPGCRSGRRWRWATRSSLTTSPPPLFSSPVRYNETASSFGMFQL